MKWRIEDNEEKGKKQTKKAKKQNKSIFVKLMQSRWQDMSDFVFLLRFVWKVLAQLRLDAVKELWTYNRLSWLLRKVYTYIFK